MPPPQFVIGVSGVTCGGKTTLTQLLRRSFPGSRVIYQDSYFYDDDDPHMVRIPEIENHVNYELLTAMDMGKMKEDLDLLFKANGNEVAEADLPGNIDGENEVLPFFEGQDIVQSATDLDLTDARSKYKDITILIIEGYLIFGLDFIYDKCDVRFFLKLEKEECSQRRSLRTTYTPPDVPGYFDKCVWPEYLKHFNGVILKNDGIQVLDGNRNINELRGTASNLILEAMEKKFPNQQ